MDARQAAGAGIAHDVAAFVLGPDEAASLDGQRAPQQRQAEILAAAAALTLEQPGRDAIGEQSRSEVVEHRTKNQLRSVTSPALECRDASEALQHLVETALVAERPGVAVAAQTGIDQARIDCAQLRIVDAG